MSADTIQSKIERIENKANRAQELNEEVQNIKQKRERAKAKNRAFEELKATISNTDEQNSTLAIWIEYAETMGLDIPESRIAETRVDIERDVKELRSKTWDDFEDADEVREIKDSFEDHRTQFSTLTEEVRETVQEKVREELDAVNRTLTLLQIPDIGDEVDQRLCESYRNHLRKLRDGRPRDDTSPAEWEEKKEAFEDLDIELGSDLTEDAKEVIWQLLRNETVTLAEIDEAVLTDLKTLEKFSQRLSIQFTNQ